MGTNVKGFYLDSNDLVDLPNARVDSNVVYLLSDVLAIAYAKYGGKEGFLSERERRLDQKRPTRRNPSRRVAEEGNPYKRLKVEEKEFDPLSLRCSVMEALPIGIIARTGKGEGEEWKSRQPIKCSCCTVEGDPHEIAAHEWFAHGRTIKPALQEGEIRLLTLTERDFTSRYLQLLEEPDELNLLMNSVSAEYSYVKDREEEDMARNLVL